MPDGRSPEPLSRAALEVLWQDPPDDQAIAALFRFMRTPRTDRVFDQLRRYCHGEQDGVSILIAGTRGMGKTTLTKLVVQRLIADDTGLIPLPLILHGPTVLRPDLSPKPRESGIVLQTHAEQRQAKELRNEQLKERVLRELIASLYRHLCTHIVEAWQNATTQDPSLTSELRQLRAHLELKLDDAPNVVALRKIWRRSRLLDSGALPHLYPCHAREWPLDQGIREIAALAACANTYLLILGVMEETVSSTTSSIASTRPPSEKPETEQKPTSPEAKRADIKDLVTLIGPPALGTVVASVIGLTGGQFGAVVAGMVFLFGIFASGFIMRRQRSEELRRDRVLKVDWGVKRLEREFPILLRRVKAAGLAPIFIVDELDKLENAAESLNGFLDLTKHIARDHAAFLFLSHRDYFEQLMPRPQDVPGGGD
jgi:nucleoside-triphosphatase THEP1